MRTRRVATWVLLSSLALALTGCSKHPLAPPAQPVGTEPGPDLRAEEVYLFQGNGWGIGSRAPIGPAPRQAVRANGGTTPAQLGDVYVGTETAPAIRQSCVGTFHGYRIRFYANDVLWWDRDSDAESSAGFRAWNDFYGLGWAPPDTGFYTIRVVLDATNRFHELDETNNVAVGIVHAVPGDLSAGMPEFSIDGVNAVTTVGVGTPVRVIASAGARGRYPTVRRVLTADGATMLDGRFDLSGGAIAGVHSDTLSFTPTSPGNFTWTMSLDPDHETLESSRINNVASRTLNVVPVP